MSNLLLGRRIKSEEYEPYPDVDLAATGTRWWMPRSTGRAACSRSCSKTSTTSSAGAWVPSPPEPADLQVLTELALAFVLAED